MRYDEGRITSSTVCTVLVAVPFLFWLLFLMFLVRETLVVSIILVTAVAHAVARLRTTLFLRIMFSQNCTSN